MGLGLKICGIGLDDDLKFLILTLVLGSSSVHDLGLDDGLMVSSSWSCS